ncbi:MAG TPA: malto-oligosyltrehalose trehalohydrolase [Candidatus Saccharimonadales bacterium]|nr:malto-oligosyltrehalose trehalohydrolase [Candidatus Saccharimonadales bacterium]
MTTIRVWAPTPESVELDVAGRRVPMTPEPDGWWSASGEDATSADYGFVLDGAEPVLPDPRSAWQPNGVHGPSRLVDHAAFRWTDQRFRAPPLSEAVIYELHVGTFSEAGTFDGVVEHLDHLVRLGITHVELMPVNEFSGERGWGYDGVDLFAPHHAYGGPDGLKRLVDAAHARGLAVLLDVVYNHLGPVGNYLDRFGPYFTDVYTTPWGPAVNFDQRGSDEVRRFVVDDALMWLRDYHVDGLRLDAVDRIVDTSAVNILEQLTQEVDALETELDRSLVLIAESDLNDPRLLRSPDLGGYGIDAQWDDDFHHALHAVLTDEQSGYYEDFGRIADLAKALREAYVYDGRRSRWRGRTRGRPATGLSGDRFVGFLQNHDQVGNRAVGDRSSQLLGPGRLKIAAALVLLSPFVPLLFQGEEWGASSPFLFFTDHRDPGLGEAVRTGRRQELERFGWDPDRIPDPQAPATFQRSKLAWDEMDHGAHADLLKWHRRLIELRHIIPELRNGRLDQVAVAFDEEERWLTLCRGSIVVAVNLAGEPRRPPIGGGPGVILMASTGGVQTNGESVYLPANSVAILRATG